MFLSIFVADFLVGQITDRLLITAIDQIYLYLMSACLMTVLTAVSPPDI